MLDFMFNAMLDRLPEDYNGWLIRTDYRIGVQIQLCIADAELSDGEKTAAALHLLYGRGVPPDLQVALDGLNWFLSCGNPAANEKNHEPDVFSFEQDSMRIVSAFKKIFGVDISREKLHWFEFVPMLGDLTGTAFTSVIDIRTTDASEINQKKRAEFVRMKKRFALANQYSSEEQAVIEKTLERVKKSQNFT